VPVGNRDRFAFTRSVVDVSGGASCKSFPTLRLTMAQALVRYLAALRVDSDDGPLFGGVFAIFGHGNVAGIGEALYAHRDVLPTYRAHNEQAMAHAAIAYAKAHMRRKMMACTTSIGPGATNLLTAAALAHVNRLPVLLLPGDVFVTRAPDPVLQQVEDFQDGTVSANDCFRPVSRYFDRITHPAQLLTALPRAVRALTDPALCGPVTLALPQDVQAMAHDYPEDFFAPAPVRFAGPPPIDAEVVAAAALVRAARKPLIVAGGGVLYAQATDALRAFAERHGVPVCETQAGKGALAWDHPLQQGSVGVTGSPAANALARDADVVIGVGTRLSDFTTGSHSMFERARLVSLNVNRFDAQKWHGVAVVADAAAAVTALSRALEGWSADTAWTGQAKRAADDWRDALARITGARDVAKPYEGDVIGAVQRSSPDSPSRDVVVCAAGTLPAELHKLWRTALPGGYHMEYGYSCMGYEIAGGLGVKMARPDREVIVMLGDGSYLMLNSEIATSVMLGMKLVVVVLDNRGFGCINRLQQACGGAPFNNLLADCLRATPQPPAIDFAAHAIALGARGENVASIAELEAALARARASDRTYVIAIETDPDRTTEEGGWWWDVAVPEVSPREKVREARARYEREMKAQRP
jgi:3D-(3,5/4)-trihydroxycyclohexane-1,2-dione acylhydrolase (decyclizing)